MEETASDDEELPNIPLGPAFGSFRQEVPDNAFLELRENPTTQLDFAPDEDNQATGEEVIAEAWIAAQGWCTKL